MILGPRGRGPTAFLDERIRLIFRTRRNSMSRALPEPTQLNTPDLLEAFFERSQDGFFFMMLDQPVEWGPGVDKDAVLDYVFTHQRMTKVNTAMAAQFRARREGLIGLTPGDFFRHGHKG